MDTLLLVVGPQALKSDYVRAEWEYALKTCTRVIPLLRIGDHDSIPPQLANLHTPDSRTSRPEADALAEITRLVDDALGQLGTLYGVPPIPDYYVARDATAAVRGRLLADADKPIVVTSAKDMTTTVDGVGGVGKTTLATALSRACDVRRTFPDGVFWLEVGQQPDVLTLMASVGATFGDDRDQYRDRTSATARLSALLSDKRVLLVLDDVWNHDHAKDFRLAGTRCRLLVTTRSANMATKLNAQGERLQKGKYFDKTLKLDESDKNLNLELCLRLSYDDLPPDLQRRFRALGVFAPEGTFDEAAAMAVWDDADADDTDDALADLTRAGLLRRAEGHRYTQHGLLRAYARALLADAGELDATFNRYADHVTEQAAQFDTLPPEQWGQLDPLLPHVDFVGDELAARWNALTPLPNADVGTTPASSAADTVRRCGDFAYNVTNYVFRRPQAVPTPEGTRLLGMNWLECGLAASREQGDPRREALFLNVLALAWSALGEPRKALRYYKQALPLYQEVGDRGGEATALNNIGEVYRQLGEPRKALAYYEQALPMHREVGNRTMEATTLNNIGLAWSALGEPRKALEYYEQALPMHHEVGNRTVEATTLNNIGGAWSALGEKRKALEYYEQALPLSRAVGDRSGEATTLNNIGLAWSALGEPRKALAYYEQALPMHREVGNRTMEATTLNNIGLAWSALGEPRKALGYYEQALPLFQEVGDRGGEAATLNGIGFAWDDLGEKRKALEYYEQALPLSRAVGDRGGEAVTCYNMGMIYRSLGDLDKAIEFVERCVMLDEQIEHPDLESDRRMLQQLKRELEDTDS